MGTVFLNPFQLTPSGSVAVTSDPQQVASQRVESLIGTPPGERVMVPDYGVNLPGYMFEPNVAALEDDITTDVTEALALWEPSIEVLDVTPVTGQQDVGIANVNVEFTTITTQPGFTPVNTATVMVGGTVVSD